MTKDHITDSQPTTVASSALPIPIEGQRKVGELLRCLLADFFTLYLKTKNFHWHMRGAHFRDYHLLLDEQAQELFDATDAIAERARKIGECTLCSIGDIARHQRLNDSDTNDAPAVVMLQFLRDDNAALAGLMRETHEVAMRAATLLRPAYWRTGSTRLSVGHGSCPQLSTLLARVKYLLRRIEEAWIQTQPKTKDGKHGLGRKVAGTG